MIENLKMLPFLRLRGKVPKANGGLLLQLLLLYCVIERSKPIKSAPIRPVGHLPPQAEEGKRSTL